MDWEANKQMVRGDTDGYNLSIGDPVFLREAMHPYYPRFYPPDLSYPDIKPSDHLNEQLRKFHGYSSEIVVTLGAKHALHAAFYALKKVNPKYNNVGMKTPFWTTYPAIAAIQGLRFRKPTLFGKTIEVVTSPNNPDGSVDFSLDWCSPEIWDAVYAHSAYGFRSGPGSRAKISVWSAGKMLGAPGVRVGWLVTDSVELAEQARRYVELTTSGVPTTSQYHVAATLYNSERVRKEVFDKAYATLVANSIAVCWMRGQHGIYSLLNTPRTPSGMFRWMKVDDPERFQQALVKSKVHLMNGTAFGAEKDMYRLSLGQNARYTEEAIEAFNKAYGRM